MAAGGLALAKHVACLMHVQPPPPWRRCRSAMNRKGPDTGRQGQQAELGWELVPDTQSHIRILRLYTS
jgi:hypothetical protein